MITMKTTRSRSLTLEMPEDLRLEINGHVFDVRKSDADILNRCAKFQDECADLKKDDIVAVRDAVNAVIEYIDEILGDGAVLKISGGRPVGIACAVTWLAAICGEISRSNDDYISAEYEAETARDVNGKGANAKKNAKADTSVSENEAV